MNLKPKTQPVTFVILILFLFSLFPLFPRPLSAREDSSRLFYYASRLDCEKSREYLGNMPDPKSSYFALLELGKCYQQNGNYRESLTYLKKAYSSNPSQDAAPFLLAYSFYRIDDLAGAKSWIRAARERKGPNAERSEALSRLIYAGIPSTPSREAGREPGGKSFTALTDLGKAVTFTQVKAGRISLKLEEEIRITSEPLQLPGARLTESSTISPRIGEFFGIGFVVPDIDFGDAVTIEYEFEFPSAQAGNEPVSLNKDQETYDQIFSRSTQYIYALPPSESPAGGSPAGKCIQRLFSNGKLLVSHEFQLEN